jgi:hypothetical protein
MPQIGGGAQSQPDVMGNLINLMQVMNQRSYQRAQTVLQQHQQEQAGLQLLSVLMQNTPDPSRLEPFIKELAPHMGISEQSLLNLASNISPSEQAVRGGAAREGRATQTPEQRTANNAEATSQVTTGQTGFANAMSEFLTNQLGGQMKIPEVASMLGQAGLIRQLTGQTPGAFSIDQAIHNMHPEEVNSAARMASGLTPNAGQQLSAQVEMRGQDLGYSTSMAGNRLGWANLAQSGQLGMLDLQVRKYLGEVQMNGRASLGITDIPELVKTQQSLVTNLQGAVTPAARQQYLNSLGTVNSLLNSLGVPTPQVDPTGDVNQFNSGNLLHPGTSGLFEGRRTLPVYQPGMQYPQGAQQFFNPAQVPFPYSFQQPEGSR